MSRKLFKFLFISAYHLFFLYLSTSIVLKGYALLLKKTDPNLFLHVSFLGLFTLIYMILMWKDLYSHSYHYYLRPTVKIVIKNLTFSALSTLILVFFVADMMGQMGNYTGNSYNYHTTLVFLLFGIAVFFALHFLQFLWIGHLSKLGFFQKNVLIVGRPDERFPVKQLFQDVGHTKREVGMLEMRQGKWLFHNTGYLAAKHVEGSIADLLYQYNIGEVIIFVEESLKSEAIHEIVGFCRENSIGHYLVPDIKKLPKVWPWNRPFSYIPIIERYGTNRDSLILISFKRFFDLLVSSVSILVFLPLMAILALLIKLYDGGPVLYASTRIGINGRKIRFFKFRSMVLNAEKLKKDLLKYNERPDGPLFKMLDDPRVTPIGRFLRNYSLDELPQLFNVFRGDMSIIGPRPQLPEEVAKYSSRDFLRLECIPGISCLPQINGRDTIGFREWVDLDLEYRKKWSPLLDFVIIWKTIKVVLRPIFSKQEK